MIKTILIVDDTADLLQNLTEFLSMEGFKIHAAPNGAEAMKILATEKPDLIITDLLMPVMDGFELIRQVRAEPSLRYIPVIVFSAMPPNENESKIYELGANDFVKKPSTIDSLIHAIGKL